MLMLELKSEHCEFKENVEKVKNIFIENYNDEYQDERDNIKIIEKLKKIGENKLARLYDKYRNYNAMLEEILGW